MDNKKIGLFISNKRKQKGLTQKQLGEQLSVSDKAVSRWERGIHLPDASLYIPLCQILDISLNEFFLGENKEIEVKEEILKEDYQKMLKKERWNIIILIISLISVPISTFIWTWNLAWLKLNPELTIYSYLGYLSFLYIIAYILVFKKIRFGYIFMWIIYFIMTSAVIAYWGYNYRIMVGNLDLWINILLTIRGFYHRDIGTSGLFKR